MTKKIPLIVQLIAGFSLIFIAVMSITGFFTYRYSSQIILEKTTLLLLESIIQMRGKMDVMLRDFDQTSQMIAFNPLIQTYLTNIDRGRPNKTTPTEIERFMKEQSRYSGTELGISIMDAEGTMYHSRNSLTTYWRTRSDMTSASWYPALQNNRGRVLWLSGPAWRNGKIPAVVGVRELNSWTSFQKIGHLFIVFPVEALGRLLQENNIDDTRKVQLIDELGIIVYSTNREEIGTELDVSLRQKVGKSKTDVISTRMNGTQTYISYTSSEYSGLTIASYIEVPVAIRDVLKIQRAVFIIGVVGLTAAILITAFYSWSVSKPIQYLAMRLGRVNKGMVQPSKGPFVNREVAVLYESFNNMVRNLDRTVKDLSDKQITEKQAQIVALKAQFRPHFLYNSLNTIYWELINEGKDKVAQMVLTLSDLLRYSIQPGSEMVTVKEDLEQLKRYMLLQNARYGDKLQLELDVDKRVLDCRIMKLLLQPLVENAVTHGLETVKGRPWLVRIAASTVDSDKIRFIVEDNGIGMSEKAMKEALSFGKGNDPIDIMHTGLGLANLHHRIGLIYGKEYGIRLANSSLGGLRAEVTLPVGGG
ncbi:sensor histidine kinase [uncultured Paenibacillus sp.]|uniref:sensor histidine kinase n=1 Tax=uncultured Paenibacillus sp. TaxID=227322 RepID=UPI0028D604FC|nr:sensor histidine kinase [uncultured Paenibacillus sp.]